jgi:hypothetical protein
MMVNMPLKYTGEIKKEQRINIVHLVGTVQLKGVY